LVTTQVMSYPPPQGIQRRYREAGEPMKMTRRGRRHRARTTTGVPADAEVAAALPMFTAMKPLLSTWQNGSAGAHRRRCGRRAITRPAT
jgi:hypothetical protein